MSQLQTVLQELVPAPSGEPGERFTIDPDRAVQQLGKLQLPRPDFYLLKLIQAGVASGAPKVEVQVGWFGITINFQPPSPLDWHNLFHHLLAPGGPLNHLAVGVNAALGQGLRSVALEQGGLRQLHTAKGCWEESCLPMEGLAIHIRRFAPGCPEVELLSERCMWSPAPVIVNGKMLAALWGEHHLVQSYLFDDGGHNRLRAPGSSRSPLPPRLASHQLGPTVLCQAMVGLERGQYPRASLDLVKDGVVIARHEVQMDATPPLVGVLEIGELATDLSGFNLSQGVALNERIEQVCGEARKMRERYELSRK